METQKYGGKGSGASIELIKARIWHAFEKIPETNKIKLILPEKRDKLKQKAVVKRYTDFGFKIGQDIGPVFLTLKKEDYYRLKQKGIYRHHLVE